MNAACKCFCLVVSSLLLAGCASSGTADLAGRPSSNYDQAYMAAIESASQKAGVDVVWINPPRVDDQDE